MSRLSLHRLRGQARLPGLLTLSGVAAMASVLLPTLPHGDARRADAQRHAAQAAPAPLARFAGPTASQSLALSANGAFLAVANADNHTLSLFDLRQDRHRKLAEVPVGQEPSSVALLPDGSKAYVANTVSGTVSVLRLNLANGGIGRPREISVGTEPAAVVLTPNGRKLYVANARSHTISVIDTATDTVLRTISGVGFEPRGLAVSNNGDASDTDEQLYVSEFLSRTLAGKVDGADDAKDGLVTVLSTADESVLARVAVKPLADTGFKANGDALARIAPGGAFDKTTGAYVNQLASVALKDGFAYLPNTGASPNGPVRFDVNTQSLVSVIDRQRLVDAGQTVNLHRAVADQPAAPKLFVTQPWAMAFKHGSREGYVVSAASNHLLRVVADAASGRPLVQPDPLDAGRVHQIKVGRNPRAIVINAGDTRAYVHNFIGRDVSVIDLSQPAHPVLATLKSAAQPQPGTLAERVHIGKELYNTSIGEFDPPPAGSLPIVGRMSNNGWGSCATCHTPAGLSDNVVWIFGPGPRRTIPQHADFDAASVQRSVMRTLNWSAERDEQEDFELNIRNVSGGLGLIVQADGVTPDPNVVNLTPVASGGRNQLTVRGVGAWDAIRAFQQFGIRAPISPVPANAPDVQAGRALFAAANCQSCHGGAQWTSARLNFVPPPNPAQVAIVAGQITDQLRQVGTFDPGFFNEVRQNAAAPLGAAGFAPATLLSLHAFNDVFLHNGRATSLGEVLDNVAHRSAGTSGVDTLSSAADRDKLLRFLLSIDASTPPFLPLQAKSATAALPLKR